MRRSRRNQGLPPDFPPITRESPLEAIDQGVATSSHEEENLVVERGDQFTSYINPLVQQPPMVDTSFHPHMEGHIDSPVAPEYGLDAPFWWTSIG